MTATARRALPFRLDIGRHRGLIIAASVFILIILGLQLVSETSLGYFELSYLSSGGTTLALLAMGQTLVILTGGFDLSCGATLSLVNSVLAANMGESIGSQILWSIIGLGIGVAVGAVNGFFVAFMRLQSVVVTLATMFIIQGLAILVLPKPGGRIGSELSTFLTYDAIPNVLPAPVIVLGVALLVWGLVKRTRFGTTLYAVGSDQEAARANGVAVRWVVFKTYLFAGLYYGAAGVFVGATTGSGDALVGKPMLMSTFAAVVLGGTLLGGGRGGLVGTVFGCFTLMITVNILLVLNVSAFYATMAEAIVIILAVVGASISRTSPFAAQMRALFLRLRAWRDGTLPSSIGGTDRTVRLVEQDRPRRVDPQLTGPRWRRWLRRNRETLGFVLPAYVLSIVVIAATFMMYGSKAMTFNYVNSLLLLTSFIAILGLGQGAVILAGGFDLSVPWTITFCGLMFTSMVNGADAGLWWVIPLVLLIGAAVGLFNGFGVAVMGLSPVVITLATNGLMHGITLVTTEVNATRFGAPAVNWFVNGSILGFSPTVWFLALFIVFGWFLLSRTAFGRRVFAVGCGHRAARMSGINVGATLIGTYVLSGICSAIVGLLLVGFGNLAVLGMGEAYMLPAIAVVIVGGTLVTGGRGHYLGIFGGALLLTGLSTLLAGTTWPEAVRDILVGLVVLGAIITLRERFS
ncbi:MAG: ABC transporter permease [Alphaproteobacteria bacterium]|nr:ABC transporter permease [Alphaproteobacteria bacterium]